MYKISEDNNEERFIASSKEYEFNIEGSAKNVSERIQRRNNEELSKAMEKYMPIGSVVKIKNSFNNYMLIGFNCEKGNERYDYLACEYPFGLDVNHQITAFNHDQIEKIFHIGFVNNQEKSFKVQLNQISDNNSELENEEER